MLRGRVPSSPLQWAESLNCRRWEGFTTDTNDGQLEHRRHLARVIQEGLVEVIST